MVAAHAAMVRTDVFMVIVMLLCSMVALLYQH